MNDSLRLHVQRITHLPTLPVTARNILAVVDDDLASVNKLENIIENDPAISAKILSVANSAMYGFRTPANTLNNAIVRIGFSNVKNIALGISLMTVLESGKHKSALDYQRVFNHSIAVGLTATLLSKNLEMGVSEEMLIIGILHDIGFLVLSRYFTDTYLKVLDACDGEKTLLDAEKEVFDFTHCDIGKWLAEKWALPDAIVDTISYHHSPSAAKGSVQHVALVHAADVIATQCIMSVTTRDPNYPFDPACLDILGISGEDFHELENQVKNELLLNGSFRI